MKRIIISVFLVAAFQLASVTAQKIKGSDTVLPLTQKLAENFSKKFPKARITVTGGGSGIGISSLIDGSTHIAMTSRKIKFDERQRIKKAGKTTKEIIVANDALTIIVHPRNPVTRLTREQLEGIFTGKIRNWNQVGGLNVPITAYSRETTSGTYEFFKEVVLKNKNYRAGILSMPATGAIIQSVNQTPGAIGYVGMAYATKEVKEIHVSFDGGKKFIQPTLANAQSGVYPIVRPLYYYYDVKFESIVKPFLNFIFSNEGKKIVSTVGYIPVK